MNPRKIDDEARRNAADRARLARQPEVEQQVAPPGTPRATSNEPCRFCEVPGFRGCRHQRPYQPGPGREAAPKQGRRRAYHTKWGA